MGRVITFAQQKGGSGKTTLVAHLAHAAQLTGHSVALLDLDPQGSLTRWAEVGGIEGISLVETASYRAGSDIRSARDKFDTVLVDCPGSATSLLESAIRESDLVVVPCQASALDVWATEAVLTMARDEKIPARVVLNRVAPRGSAADQTAKALNEAGAVVLNTRIGNRIAFGHSFALGKTALSVSGQKRAKEEIAQFTAELEAVLTT